MEETNTSSKELQELINKIQTPSKGAQKVLDEIDNIKKQFDKFMITIVLFFVVYISVFVSIVL